MLKSSAKQERARSVLYGLVELYLNSGQPIGSNTLRDNGLDNLSSATIRNYFAKLEDEGLLKQFHSSGGRIPTGEGLKAYADYHRYASRLTKEQEKALAELERETHEVSAYLQRAAEMISDLSGCAVFLTTPRFDQDTISDIKLMLLDDTRLLAAILTQFGLVHTEVLQTPMKLSSFALKRIENYFTFRRGSGEKPELSEDEEALAEKLYSEIFLRHVVGHANFLSDDILKTGFSKLLNYPELHDATTLASSLSLFEHAPLMEELLKSCIEEGQLAYFIGDDLKDFLKEPISCSVITIPYYIQNRAIGAIALLGPMRLDYPKLFALLRRCSQLLSASLTKSSHIFEISFRKPESDLKQIEIKGMNHE